MRVIPVFRCTSVALAFATVVGSGTALATTTEFNFDNMVGTYPFNNGSLPGSQGPTASNGSIQAFMQSRLNTLGIPGATVTVQGAIASTSAIAGSTGYTGDAHVVQTGGVYKTLAHLADATDHANNAAYTVGNFYSSLNHTFLMNNGGFSGVGGAHSDSIKITFAGVQVTRVAFDWEIFPCAAGVGNCTTNPTLQFSTNTNPNVHTYTATSPAGNAQAIGDLSTGTYVLPAGTTQLVWMDWPAEIGIRGIELDICCSRQVPEPGSLPLIAAAVAGVGVVGLRRRRNS